MTMIPAAENLSKQHCYVEGYGSLFPESFGVMSRLEGYGCSEGGCLGSDLVVVGGPMADQDESRTESTVNEAGSTCKDAQEEIIRDDQGWLQLGIGSPQTHHRHHHHHTATQNNNNNIIKQDHQHHHHQGVVDHQSSRRGAGVGGPLELDLLPGSSSSEELRSSAVPMMFHQGPPRPFSSITTSSSATAAAAYNPTSLFAGGGTSSISGFPHHQDINWAFIRPLQRNIVAASPSPSSSSSYFARGPFQLHTGLASHVITRPVGGIDFRVIDPPRRPHSGIWFMLQAAENQVKEPFLPQIPKSFLRTRDGRMTIRLVIKYLVNKLKLESESEVEIRCRGQQILPFLTLQHVRDSVWSPRDALVTLLPTDDHSCSSSSSTTAADHVMVLQYGRSP